MKHLILYLLNGSDEQFLSKHWRDTRMAPHEAWTIRQRDTAVITKDVAATRRENFWKAREGKSLAKVLQMTPRKQA